MRLAYQDDADDPAGRVSMPAACRVVLVRLSTTDLAFGPQPTDALLLEHEAAHAVYHSNAWARIFRASPAWLDEGLAVWGADQERRYAAMVLGDNLRTPESVPSVRGLGLRGDHRDFGPVDYLLSGSVVAVALAQPEAQRRFLDEVYAGADAERTLYSVAGAPRDALLAQGRLRAQALIESVASDHGFDTASSAMVHQDEALLRGFLAQFPASHFVPNAAHDILKLVCRGGTAAECLAEAHEFERHAAGVAVARRVDAEFAVAASLERSASYDSCARRSLDALRRGLGALGDVDRAAGLVQFGSCAAAGGDRRELVHSGRLATQILSDRRVLATTLLELSYFASRHGYEAERNELRALQAAE
ncbi:MAG: hypothetical protein ABMA64_19375 [Myxococcota bacterium]